MKTAGVVENSGHSTYSIGLKCFLNCFSLIHLVIYIYRYIYIYCMYTHTYIVYIHTYIVHIHIYSRSGCMWYQCKVWSLEFISENNCRVICMYKMPSHHPNVSTIAFLIEELRHNTELGSLTPTFCSTPVDGCRHLPNVRHILVQSDFLHVLDLLPSRMPVVTRFSLLYTKRITLNSVENTITLTTTLTFIISSHFIIPGN